MAGAGFKTFASGEVLTAANVNTYLMQQTVMVFADSSARSTALGANVSEGMLSYLKDTNKVEVYDGSSWVASDDPNAIQNTIVDAKGDLISATAADTPARLASSGVNGEVLTIDTSTATGLKWATPASGGGFTQLATGTLSSTTTTISAISGSYIHLYLQVNKPYVNTGTSFGVQYNSTGSYDNSNFTAQGAAFTAAESGVTFFTMGSNMQTSSTTKTSLDLFLYNYTSNSDKRTNYLWGREGSANFGFCIANITSAITSISLLTGNGTSTFSGGTYTLYGVK